MFLRKSYMGKQKKALFVFLLALFSIVGSVSVYRVFTNGRNAGSETPSLTGISNSKGMSSDEKRELIKATTASGTDTLSEEQRKSLVSAATAPEKPNAFSEEQYRMMIENATAPVDQ